MASAMRRGLPTKACWRQAETYIASVPQTSAIVTPRRLYSVSSSSRASSSSSPPSKKKESLFSWIRTDLTEKILALPRSPSAIADAKQVATSPSGQGNLFDRMARELLEQTRNDIKAKLQEYGKGKDVPEIPEGLNMRALRKWEKRAMEPAPTEHRYSTAMFKISHRKLNDLGRQIAGKPIDQAILQMVFSEKRASTRIKSMLCVARDHAVDYKRLERDRLIVSEAWIEKGRKLARVEIKGRGRSGRREHPSSRLCVVLRHGKTYDERIQKEHAYKLDKIRSAGLMRENTPVRNYGPAWAW